MGKAKKVQILRKHGICFLLTCRSLAALKTLPVDRCKQKIFVLLSMFNALFFLNYIAKNHDYCYLIHQSKWQDWQHHRVPNKSGFACRKHLFINRSTCMIDDNYSETVSFNRFRLFNVKFMAWSTCHLVWCGHKNLLLVNNDVSQTNLMVFYAVNEVVSANL